MTTGPCTTLDDEVAVDFVARYESLQDDDFRRVCVHLELTVNGISARSKVGRYRREKASCYGPEERALVRRLFANEIETFGYEPSF